MIVPVALELTPSTELFSLKIPIIFSTLSKLDLHSETIPLATSLPLIFCINVSPFLNEPLKFLRVKTYFDVKLDDTVLSKWNAPPFLEIETLCGTPIDELLT